MNALLLIAVFVLVGGGNGAFNPSPCLRNPDNNAYNKFVHKHVLQEEIDTFSKPAWQDYLKKYKLCDRPRQSFVDKGAENLYVKICNGFGKRRTINLCTSTSPVHLYNLNVNTGDCSVTSLTPEDKYVTVACDKVDNQCRPVHFQDSQKEKPKSGAICQP